MDTYRRCVPAGIAQRETENEEIEEEFIEMDTNRLGHLLAYDLEAFESDICRAHGAMFDELQALIQLRPLDARSWHLSASEYENLFSSGSQDAYAWQEEFPDDRDDLKNVLLKVLRTLRAFVRTIH